MSTEHSLLLGVLICCILASFASAGHAADADAPAWTKAHLQAPMTAAETRAFMRQLAQFVFDNHLKKDAKSEQRGMVYEYLDMGRKGQHDQFLEGEGLDTMHDGAWFAAALVNAYRATGDPFYKDFLTQWVMPFYCKMLNHSDTLFTTKRNDARPGATPWGKEWALQEGEKGFVPYFWDDGGSVSLDRVRDKNPLGSRPCADFLAGKENPQFLLSGYSHGSSNHMAQDLGVMLQQAWLLLKDTGDAKLAAEVAEAAKNLHQCRMNHFSHIPMCCSPTALANADADELKRVPDMSGKNLWTPNNHYLKALAGFTPGQRMPSSGFADDQQYHYYYGIAKHGGQLPKALAFKTIYDAYTEPMLYRYYCDDAPAPAGINRFDLHMIYALDGKLTDYRSDRKGPSRQPRPAGSRMGPQNMICCGWALQALKAYPGIWEERYKSEFSKDHWVEVHDYPPGWRAEPPMIWPLTLADVTLSFIGSHKGLEMRGQCRAHEVAIKVFSQPDAKGIYAVVTMSKDKGVVAV
ncbi:MAG: hypothetical protein FJ279_23120, partial [Planctomycetes bacterium]|nr:hypothetical protein [Planctomycetota bacterium]